MPIQRITQLDAVNEILGACGQKPVNSLEGATSQWARIALNQLEIADRQIQSEGWHFNTDPDVTLSVETVSGEIPVASNVIRFEVHDEPWITVRGAKLYDRLNQTFRLETARAGLMLSLLEWDDLPEDARRYIVSKAARKTYEQFVGAAENRQNLFQEELTARAALIDMDTEAAGYNMMDDPHLPLLRGSMYVPGSPRNNPRN